MTNFADGSVISLPGSDTAWMALLTQSGALDRRRIIEHHGSIDNRRFCDIVDRFISDACMITAEMCTAYTRKDDSRMWSLIAALRLACHHAGAARMGHRAADLARHFAHSPISGWASFNRSLEVLRADLDEVWELGSRARRIK